MQKSTARDASNLLRQVTGTLKFTDPNRELLSSLQFRFEKDRTQLYDIPAVRQVVREEMQKFRPVQSRLDALAPEGFALKDPETAWADIFYKLFKRTAAAPEDAPLQYGSPARTNLELLPERPPGSINRGG